MQSAAQLRAQYRRACHERVTIRRYDANGENPKDYPARGRAKITGQNPLIGNTTQSSQWGLVLAEDLAAKGFVFPLKASDKLVTAAHGEKEIGDFDERTAVDGTLIAYAIRALG